VVEKEVVYAAVRKDLAEGREWIDMGSVRHVPEEARKVGERDQRQKAWRDNNPVVRIGRFEMREVRR
jgi:hypothetical protein